jgi:hypothetical protein
MRRAVLVMAGIGLVSTLLAPTAALAQRRGDWYTDARPYLGARSAQDARKARLWEETIALRNAVRRLDRRGDITPRQADGFYNRLDRVAHFLRNDRNLTSSEFDRRRDDLNGIARDLHRVARVRPVSRYEDRFDRRSDRRSDRRVDRCDICDGICRYR